MGNNNSSITNTNLTNIYNYIPDIIDFRDRYIELEECDYKDLVDLRGEFPNIFNIGNQWNGSIASSISALLYHELVKLNKNIFIPSRLFIFYNSLLYNSKLTNQILTIVPSIRQTLKSIAKWGFCPEQYLPYDIQNVMNQPSNTAYQYGGYYTIEYCKVNSNINDIKLVLNYKKSILCSIPIYSSFHDNNVRITGRIPYPDNIDSLIGCLSIIVVGYIHSKQLFIIRLSLGDIWGDHGYGYIPYDYLINMGMDLWCMDILPKEVISIEPPPLPLPNNIPINNYPVDMGSNGNTKSSKLPIQSRYM